MNMPTIDMIIIIGKSRNIGLLAMSRPPTVTISAIMPITATSITNGISRIIRLPGIARGTSGGGARLTSPPGIRGGATRRRRTNPCVLNLPSPEAAGAGCWVLFVSSNPIAQEADWFDLTAVSSRSWSPTLEAEPELSRLTLVVGELNIDVGLPAHVSIAQYIPDVIDIANEQITANDAIVEFDAADGQWTLAPLGGEPIAPHLSLGEAGVYDGDLLMICAAGQPVSPLLFDDVDDTQRRRGRGRHRAELVHGQRQRVGRLRCHRGRRRHAGGRRWHVGPPCPRCPRRCWPSARWGCCWPAWWRTGRAAAGTSAWIAAVSMPLVFAGSLYVVPDGSGATSLPMAFALTAFGALLVLLVSGSGSGRVHRDHRGVHFRWRQFHGNVAVAAAHPIGGALCSRPSAVIVVYLAPRVTIGLSKLPIPRVPTAGEPLDDIETQGGTTVEGVNAIGKQIIPTEEDLISRVRRANQHLTGILVAAALAALVGCYLAVDVSNGFYWQGTVFAIMVATVLCLRGRGHHDLVQSATLIGSGLTIAVAVILKTAVNVEGWQARAVVVLLALMVLILACGLVAPLREFSPVMRRQVEILEYIAVGSLFPLCFWIIRVYAFFREMRL